MIILFLIYRELIFIWSKLQLKSNPSKQVFVDQCYQLLRTATNVRVIFPFMKIIKDEVNRIYLSLKLKIEWQFTETWISFDKIYLILKLKERRILRPHSPYITFSSALTPNCQHGRLIYCYLKFNMEAIASITTFFLIIQYLLLSILS